MSARRLPLIVGVGEDNLLVPIRRARRGLQCKCFCPCCGARLSAKRGKVNAHHFAHHQAGECAGAVESGLHRFAKAVLHHHKAIALPPVFAHGVERPLRSFRTFRYRRTGEEVPLKGFVADAVLYGFEKIIVELKVSHAVDPYKQRVFIRSGIQSVEIDVRAIFEELVEEGRGEDTKELARRIIRFGERNGGLAVHGRWLFNPEQHGAEHRRRTEATVLRVGENKWKGKTWFRTLNCPDNSRNHAVKGENWQRTYARTFQDCSGCPHLREFVFEHKWVGFQWTPVRVVGVRCGYPGTS